MSTRNWSLILHQLSSINKGLTRRNGVPHCREAAATSVLATSHVAAIYIFEGSYYTLPDVSVELLLPKMFNRRRNTGFALLLCISSAWPAWSCNDVSSCPAQKTDSPTSKGRE